MNIIQSLRTSKQSGKKSIAILIDPDKVEEPANLNQLINLASEYLSSGIGMVLLI